MKNCQTKESRVILKAICLFVIASGCEVRARVRRIYIIRNSTEKPPMGTFSTAINLIFSLYACNHMERRNGERSKERMPKKLNYKLLNTILL